MHNHITDVAGIRVGHAGCETLVSGVTTVLFDQPAVGAVAVMVGAPAGRDTECLAANRSLVTSSLEPRLVLERLVVRLVSRAA